MTLKKPLPQPSQIKWINKLIDAATEHGLMDWIDNTMEVQMTDEYAQAVANMGVGEAIPESEDE